MESYHPGSHSVHGRFPNTVTTLALLSTDDTKPVPAGVFTQHFAGYARYQLNFPDALQIRGPVFAGRVPSQEWFPRPATFPAGAEYPILYATEPGIYTFSLEVQWSKPSTDAADPAPSDTTALPLAVNLAVMVADVTSIPPPVPMPPNTDAVKWNILRENDFNSSTTATPYALTQSISPKGNIITRNIVQNITGRVIFEPPTPSSRLAVYITAMSDLAFGLLVPQIRAFSMVFEQLGALPFHSLVKAAAPSAAAPAPFAAHGPSLGHYGYGYGGKHPYTF